MGRRRATRYHGKADANCSGCPGFACISSSHWTCTPSDTYVAPLCSFRTVNSTTTAISCSTVRPDLIQMQMRSYLRCCSMMASSAGGVLHDPDLPFATILWPCTSNATKLTCVCDTRLVGLHYR